MVAVEFDPAKDEHNVAKHGVSLAFGAVIFLDKNHLLLSAMRPVDGTLYTAVHVYRGAAIRFISVRRSNHGEERLYHRA